MLRGMGSPAHSAGAAGARGGPRAGVLVGQGVKKCKNGCAVQPGDPGTPGPGTMAPTTGTQPVALQGHVQGTEMSWGGRATLPPGQEQLLQPHKHPGTPGTPAPIPPSCPAHSLVSPLPRLCRGGEGGENTAPESPAWGSTWHGLGDPPGRRRRRRPAEPPLPACPQPDNTARSEVAPALAGAEGTLPARRSTAQLSMASPCSRAGKRHGGENRPQPSERQRRAAPVNSRDGGM